jgi:hypothetical protein
MSKSPVKEEDAGTLLAFAASPASTTWSEADKLAAAQARARLAEQERDTLLQLLSQAKVRIEEVERERDGMKGGGQPAA